MAQGGVEHLGRDQDPLGAGGHGGQQRRGIPRRHPPGRGAYVIEAGHQVKAGLLGGRPRLPQLLVAPAVLAGFHPDTHNVSQTSAGAGAGPSAWPSRPAYHSSSSASRPRRSRAAALDRRSLLPVVV
jgi:hypothetical protein